MKYLLAVKSECLLDARKIFVELEKVCEKFKWLELAEVSGENQKGITEHLFLLEGICKEEITVLMNANYIEGGFISGFGG